VDGRESVFNAEVRAAELLDRLVVVPRSPGERRALSGALVAALPGVKLGRSAEGISVPGHDADRLLDVADIELHWRPEARLFAENRRRVKRALPHIREDVARIRDGGRKVAESYLPDADGLSVLDDHQWVNVAAMTLAEGFGLCLFDEQGAGKTVTLIHAFDLLVARDQVDVVLIVAPKSMVPEWVSDFARFKGDLYRVEMLVGTRRQKRSQLRSTADVLVTNFETAVTLEDEIGALLRRHHGRAMLVVDESFFIKNLDARRTRALKRLREYCCRAFVLCGTPAPNAPQDLIEQFSIVDFGQTFGGVSVPDERAAAGPIVQRAVEDRGVFIRHLKSKALPDLPGKRFTRLLLPLEPKQRRLYSSALQGLILDLRSTTDAVFQRNLPSFLARRSTLLQICSHPAAVADGYRETPAKMLALDDFLEEVIGGRREKVVLWSFYRASLVRLVERFTRFNPVRYDGTVSEVADRREAVRKFQEDDKTMLFIGNPAAAGAGLTLHRARVAVYESLSNQAAHYLQSLDRIHRRGQSREVEYVVLLCDGTVEITEYDRLTAKERSAHRLLRDDVVTAPTRQMMLGELLASQEMLKGRSEEG